MKHRILFSLLSLLLCLILLTGCAMPSSPQESAPAYPSSQPAQAAEPAAPEAAPASGFSGQLRISEVMARNRATLADRNGTFPDWIELENISGGELKLAGWSVSDKEGSAWTLPDMILEPGSLVLLLCNGEQGPAFSLSEGETLRLYAPDGTEQDAVRCAAAADCSQIRSGDSGFTLCAWPTPCRQNSAAGYEEACAERTAAGLCIWEAASANRLVTLAATDEQSDWVELKNAGPAALMLEGCSLTDDPDEPRKYLLPARELAPGELLLLACEGDLDASEGNTGFSLSASGDALYLYDASGALLDYVSLHDIPMDGSVGRMEGCGGFFRFPAATPGEANGEGLRRVSAAPVALTPDGCYDGTQSVSAALSAAGTIRYTTDGSLPDESSPVYTGPIPLDVTTVIRAAAWEEGALASEVVTFSYFLNENHSLPVLSLAVDDAAGFKTMYDNSWKNHVLDANLAFYDGEHSFNRRCGVSLKGWTSLALPKKSLGVDFKGVYGGNLEADVFGNGVTEFSTLAIRAGQDYPYAIFRNELVEELCLEGSETLYTQASKYCVLYINGAYQGIYCLKEDFSRQYYASHTGTDKSSCTVLKTPVGPGSGVYEDVVTFAWYEDLSVEENYRQVCETIDIDSFIDWFLFESFCANTDTQGNCRLMRSSQTDGLWDFALYDLDWGFWYAGSDFSVLLGGFGNTGSQFPPLLRALMKNADFRDRCFTRFAELNRGVLSNAHVLAKIDELEALLEPEAARDRERWLLSIESWHVEVEKLRAFILDNDWEAHNVDMLCEYADVTPEERAHYFGYLDSREG